MPVPLNIILVVPDVVLAVVDVKFEVLIVFPFILIPPVLEKFNAPVKLKLSANIEQKEENNEKE